MIGPPASRKATARNAPTCADGIRRWLGAAPEHPLAIYGPGSNPADQTLFQVASAGEVLIAGGSGDGYRLAELMSATQGEDTGYIPLYANP